MAFKVDRLSVGPLGTNCYMAYCPETMSGVVVDPGYSASRISQRIGELGVNVKGILLTHGHFDHVTEAEALARDLGVDVSLHIEDWGQFKFTGELGELEDGDTIVLGNTHLKVLHTPGHTRGCVCFHAVNEGILLSGDTLFKDGIGRTDLPGGSYRELMDSLRNRILTLPPETLVFPGHGPGTTVGEEAMGLR